MKGPGQNLAVVTVIAVASIGAAACGSSSSSKTTAASTPAAPSTPATPSTPTSTTAGGPLTKATYNALAKPFDAASSQLKSAVATKDDKQIAAAAASWASAARTFESGLAALKPSSAEATKAQAEAVSLLKQAASLGDELHKNAAAGDVSAANQQIDQINTLNPKLTAAGQQLAAALQ